MRWKLVNNEPTFPYLSISVIKGWKRPNKSVLLLLAQSDVSLVPRPDGSSVFR